MNREIKFRAFVDDEMYPVTNLDYINDGSGIIAHIHVKGINQEIPSGQFELMQYTGLKDKNGVEIYEGDYVLYPHKSGGGFAVSEARTDWIQCEVKWKAGGLAAYWGHNDCNIVTFNFKQFIVIGNIFEGVDK